MARAALDLGRSWKLQVEVVGTGTLEGIYPQKNGELRQRRRDTVVAIMAGRRVFVSPEVAVEFLAGAGVARPRVMEARRSIAPPLWKLGPWPEDQESDEYEGVPSLTGGIDPVIQIAPRVAMVPFVRAHYYLRSPTESFPAHPARWHWQFGAAVRLRLH